MKSDEKERRREWKLYVYYMVCDIEDCVMLQQLTWQLTIQASDVIQHTQCESASEPCRYSNSIRQALLYIHARC